MVQAIVYCELTNQRTNQLPLDQQEPKRYLTQRVGAVLSLFVQQLMDTVYKVTAIK